MGHPSIGAIVRLTYPLVVKQGYRRLNPETQEPEQEDQQIEMVETPAVVVHVEPQRNEQNAIDNDLCPIFDLAYLNRKKVNLLGTTDWRNAFDKMERVHPLSHPNVIEAEATAYYEDEDVHYELRAIQAEKEAQLRAAQNPPEPSAEPSAEPKPEKIHVPVPAGDHNIEVAALRGAEEGKGAGIAADGANGQSGTGEASQ